MPHMPCDPKQAASYAAFVSAAWQMFKSDESSLKPLPRAIPPGWDLIAWITMCDFAFENVERFYGIVVEHPSQGHVVAFRSTADWQEWLQLLDCVAVPFAQVPDAGTVVQGFDAIYGTLKLYARDGESAYGAGAEKSERTGLSGSFGEQMDRLMRSRADRFPRTAPAIGNRRLAARDHRPLAWRGACYFVRYGKRV